MTESNSGNVSVVYIVAWSFRGASRCHIVTHEFSQKISEDFGWREPHLLVRHLLFPHLRISHFLVPPIRHRFVRYPLAPPLPRTLVGHPAVPPLMLT
jgi:hypothetical protein